MYTTAFANRARGTHVFWNVYGLLPTITARERQSQPNVALLVFDDVFGDSNNGNVPYSATFFRNNRRGLFCENAQTNIRTVDVNWRMTLALADAGFVLACLLRRSDGLLLCVSGAMS